MDAGQGVAQRPGDLALVLRVREREQQADGDRLGAVGPHRLDGPRQRGRVERRDHPLGAAALGDLVAALGGDQRGRVVSVQAVERGARLAPQLEDVAEALGGHERRAGSGPLEEGVGSHGHPVAEARDVGGAHARPLERHEDGGHHALALIVRRRGDLRRHQPPAGHDDGVGERAAHVNADQGAFRR